MSHINLNSAGRPAPTGFQIKPWMVVVAILLLIGALVGPSLAKSDCEKAWDQSAYSRQGADSYHSDYIRACEDGHRSLP